MASAWCRLEQEHAYMLYHDRNANNAYMHDEKHVVFSNGESVLAPHLLQHPFFVDRPLHLSPFFRITNQLHLALVSLESANDYLNP